jgi:hypothetical protein
MNHAGSTTEISNETILLFWLPPLCWLEWLEPMPALDGRIRGGHVGGRFVRRDWRRAIVIADLQSVYAVR